MIKIETLKKTQINIIGQRIDNLTLEEALSLIEDFIHNRTPRAVFTPNVDHLVKLRKDREFKEAYMHCDLTLPDSQIVMGAGRFLKTPFKEKVSGVDLLPRFCDLASRKGYRIFFLGSETGVAQRAAEILSNRHPSLQIAGTYSPPRGFEESDKENNRIVEMIAEAKPDVLFVGLGAPKQEKWIHRHKDQYRCPVSLGVGAAFDFIAGKVKRAPDWMSRNGMEWLWRLSQEPERLWKRYLIDDPPFFYWLLLQKLKGS